MKTRLQRRIPAYTANTIGTITGLATGAGLTALLNTDHPLAVLTAVAGAFGAGHIARDITHDYLATR